MPRALYRQSFPWLVPGEQVGDAWEKASIPVGDLPAGTRGKDLQVPLRPESSPGRQGRETRSGRGVLPAAVSLEGLSPEETQVLLTSPAPPLGSLPAACAAAGPPWVHEVPDRSWIPTSDHFRGLWIWPPPPIEIYE